MGKENQNNSEKGGPRGWNEAKSQQEKRDIPDSQRGRDVRMGMRRITQDGRGR